MSSFPSTLCEQTIGRFLPINIDRLRIFGRRPVRIDDNDPFRQGSCPTNPPESTTDRTKFGVRGCVVYGYPSTGGVLIKGSVDLVDMVFLSLPRFHEA
jgi:hypothetical protein